MASGDSDDLERLLREVEESLGNTGAPPARQARSPAARGSTPARREEEPPSRFDVAVAGATAWGAGAAAAVFVLFTVLPFLGGVSGAAGAFVGVFLVVLFRNSRGRS